jgi:hypothetical protein
MDSRPIRIFAQEDSSRLRYIAGIILGDIMGLSWDITTDRRKLGKHFVINYSEEEIKGSFRIKPASILFEKGILEKEISVIKWKDLPVFFPAPDGSDIPFDIFAAAFYLVTRYEEYCENEPDEFGRYRAASSVAFKNGFLEIPVVELWAREFTKLLLRKFQNLVFKRNEFSSLVTFDADEPFEYLGKSIIRSIGGLLHDLTAGDRHASERYQTVAKGKPDPFEVFGYISDCIDKTGSDARFFFPVGDRSKYDHNPSWKNEEYRSLILRLSGKYSFGIHPSFSSSTNITGLEKEIVRLKTITDKNITNSRFHYVRLKMPASYNNLVFTGIGADYSMGYAEEPGFRAGIARPFYFYDLEQDVATNLKIIPFQVMDVTLYRYKKLDPQSSQELILKIISETRKVGGLFVSIWHNTSLLDNKECKPWRSVFETMLTAQK